MWTTERIAEFAVAFRDSRLTDPVRDKVGDCILDAIACAACGASTRSASVVADAATAAFRGGDVPIWFTGRTSGAMAAAYANAAAVSAHDLDDGNRVALGHPGAAIVPAVLAAARTLDSPGPEVQAAIAIGYQAASAVSASERIRSFASGNWTGFGVAAAIGRLRALPASTIAQALAIVAYQGPHLIDLTKSRLMGANVKEMIPWSVVNGFMALDLAVGGFTAPLDALDLDDRYEPERAAAALSGPLLVERTYFKRYASCRFMHTALDGLVAIMADHGISADEIERIEVGTFRKGIALENGTRPASIESAQYSFPFSLAAVAVHGPGVLAPMSKALLNDLEVRRIADDVALALDPEVDAVAPAEAPAEVTVAARGTTFRRRVPHAWGDPGSGVGRSQLIDKFRMIAAEAMAPARIERIALAVDRVADQGVRPLTQLLGASRSVREQPSLAAAG